MRERNQAVSARLFIGVMFLLCGVLWTLDNLNIVESEPILDWWPLALVIFGLFHFAGAFGPRRGLAGTVWTTLGVLMVAHNFGYFPLSLFELWPVVLIGIGASIVWRSYRGPQAGQQTGCAWKRRSFGSAYSRAHAAHIANPLIVVAARS